MAEMIERVARALNEFEMGGMAAHYPRYDELNEEDRQVWRDEARAAIAAMHEPTPAMLSAADAVTPISFHWGRESADISGTKIIWQAMIGAALAG